MTARALAVRNFGARGPTSAPLRDMPAVLRPLGAVFIARNIPVRYGLSKDRSTALFRVAPQETEDVRWLADALSRIGWRLGLKRRPEQVRSVATLLWRVANASAFPQQGGHGSEREWRRPRPNFTPSRLVQLGRESRPRTT